MSSAREQELEGRLSSLIHEHADWLTGPAWMAIAERFARGYFDDLPELFDADAFLSVVNDGLNNG